MVLNDIPKVTTALVSLVISQSLYDISKAVHEDIGNALYKKYKCYFSDCLEHPDYLIDVLKQVFGDGYISIVSNINKRLEEFSYKEPINKFLLEINK